MILPIIFFTTIFKIFKVLAVNNQASLELYKEGSIIIYVIDFCESIIVTLTLTKRLTKIYLFIQMSL